MKSYIYGVQGIMDFMGISALASALCISWLQDAGKNTQKYFLFHSFHIRIEHIAVPGQLDGGDRSVDLV